MPSAPVEEYRAAVDEPGVYQLSDAAYHADPVPWGSLSNSGAKKLLPPSCPAKFRYELDHPPARKKEFEIGHAAHNLVLGDGPELVVVDRDRWDTNAVKAEVAEIRERGGVPLKRAEYDAVQAMATALRQHPYAGKLFEDGRPEQSLFWVCDDTGVWCRARLDWLPNSRGNRLIVADYKTTDQADTESLRRDLYRYGYYRQAAWYLDGIAHVWDSDCDHAFVFVCQEKTPPYLVNVIEPDAAALAAGRERNRTAREVYRDCKAADVWPGYADDIELVSLPGWAPEARLQEVW
jgi:hypothetical protein